MRWKTCLSPEAYEDGMAFLSHLYLLHYHRTRRPQSQSASIRGLGFCEACGGQLHQCGVYQNMPGIFTRWSSSKLLAL